MIQKSISLCRRMNRNAFLTCYTRYSAKTLATPSFSLESQMLPAAERAYSSAFFTAQEIPAIFSIDTSFSVLPKAMTSEREISHILHNF